MASEVTKQGLFIRPAVRAFSAYEPGRSIEEIRQRYGLDEVIKLASNENPLGTSPLVQDVLKRHAGDVFRYPAGGNPRLVHALAEHHGVDPARVIVSNGSDELIDLLFRVCAEPGVHNAVAFKPCFGIYTTQAKMAGVTLRQAPLREDFSFPWEELLALVDEQTTLVLVTSPDNPSGRAATAAELEKLARALPTSCLLLIDEAYVDFVRPEDGGEDAFSLLRRLDDFPNVGIMRTFSKSWGLAGLRLGYGLLPTELTEHLWRVRLPFSVNLAAEEAALAALKDTEYRAETLKTVHVGRALLEQELTRMQCTVIPSQANFLMFSLPQDFDAKAINEGLLQGGFIVRQLTSYGLPQYLRLTVGTEEQNIRFVKTLQKLLHGV